MPPLVRMPGIRLPRTALKKFGKQWSSNGKSLSRTPPNSSSQLGHLVDTQVAQALAAMLGSVPVVSPTSGNALLPPQPDCVELGSVRIIGGVRPQNFDVGYRPDGVRFAFDSKTLNDLESVRKNYQNMINDLATEATTVHTRFPYALVAFIVLVPAPCLVEPQRTALIGTLRRLTGRQKIDDPHHFAEAIALAVWNPGNGRIDSDIPPQGSRLRIEEFSKQVQSEYFSRYQGLPPHAL
jgi:hypothetical protein